jgi:hypothetical protein
MPQLADQTRAFITPVHFDGHGMLIQVHPSSGGEGSCGVVLVDDLFSKMKVYVEKNKAQSLKDILTNKCSVEKNPAPSLKDILTNKCSKIIGRVYGFEIDADRFVWKHHNALNKGKDYLGDIVNGKGESLLDRFLKKANQDNSWHVVYLPSDVKGGGCECYPFYVELILHFFRTRGCFGGIGNDKLELDNKVDDVWKFNDFGCWRNHGQD